MHAPFHKTAVAAGLLAFALAAGAAAQTSATATAPAATGSKSTSMSTSQGAGDAKLARGDRKFVENAAQGGMAEVQFGQLAAQKGQSAEVKQFGQKMVDDHTKANDQLKSIAGSKGITLPADLTSADKREHDKLSKLSGADFDREYMKHMVSDHKKDVSDFRKEAKSGKDADVKNFASTTLPTLEQHLQQAQSTDATVRTASRGGNTTRTNMGTTGRMSTSGAGGATTSGTSGATTSRTGSATTSGTGSATTSGTGSATTSGTGSATTTGK